MAHMLFTVQSCNQNMFSKRQEFFGGTEEDVHIEVSKIMGFGFRQPWPRHMIYAWDQTVFRMCEEHIPLSGVWHRMYCAVHVPVSRSMFVWAPPYVPGANGEGIILYGLERSRDRVVLPSRNNASWNKRNLNMADRCAAALIMACLTRIWNIHHILIVICAMGLTLLA